MSCNRSNAAAAYFYANNATSQPMQAPSQIVINFAQNAAAVGPAAMFPPAPPAQFPYQQQFNPAVVNFIMQPPFTLAPPFAYPQQHSYIPPAANLQQQYSPNGALPPDYPMGSFRTQNPDSIVQPAFGGMVPSAQLFSPPTPALEYSRNISPGSSSSASKKIGGRLIQCSQCLCLIEDEFVVEHVAREHMGVNLKEIRNDLALKMVTAYANCISGLSSKYPDNRKLTEAANFMEAVLDHTKKAKPDPIVVELEDQVVEEADPNKNTPSTSAACKSTSKSNFRKVSNKISPNFSSVETRSLRSSKLKNTRDLTVQQCNPANQSASLQIDTSNSTNHCSSPDKKRRRSSKGSAISLAAVEDGVDLPQAPTTPNFLSVGASRENSAHCFTSSSLAAVVSLGLDEERKSSTPSPCSSVIVLDISADSEPGTPPLPAQQSAEEIISTLFAMPHNAHLRTKPLHCEHRVCNVPFSLKLKLKRDVYVDIQSKKAHLLEHIRLREVILEYDVEKLFHECFPKDALAVAAAEDNVEQLVSYEPVATDINNTEEAVDVKPVIKQIVQHVEKQAVNNQASAIAPKLSLPHGVVPLAPQPPQETLTPKNTLPPSASIGTKEDNAQCLFSENDKERGQASTRLQSHDSSSRHLDQASIIETGVSKPTPPCRPSRATKVVRPSGGKLKSMMELERKKKEGLQSSPSIVMTSSIDFSSSVVSASAKTPPKRSAYRSCMSSASSLNDDDCFVCWYGGDLVCCHTCRRVFHDVCHVPELLELPEGDFICTFCETDNGKANSLQCDLDKVFRGKQRHNEEGLTAFEEKLCQRVLLELICHEASDPFRVPVSSTCRSRAQFFEYLKKVPNPKDLSFVKRRLAAKNSSEDNTAEPITSVAQFIEELNQIFRNCAIANAHNSNIAKSGRKLAELYIELVHKFLPTYSSCVNFGVGARTLRHTRASSLRLQSTSPSTSAATSASTKQTPTATTSINVSCGAEQSGGTDQRTVGGAEKRASRTDKRPSGGSEQSASGGADKKPECCADQRIVSGADKRSSGGADQGVSDTIQRVSGANLRLSGSERPSSGAVQRDSGGTEQRVKTVGAGQNTVGGTNQRIVGGADHNAGSGANQRLSDTVQRVSDGAFHSAASSGDSDDGTLNSQRKRSYNSPVGVLNAFAMVPAKRPKATASKDFVDTGLIAKTAKLAQERDSKNKRKQPDGKSNGRPPGSKNKKTLQQQKQQTMPQSAPLNSSGFDFPMHCLPCNGKVFCSALEHLTTAHMKYAAAYACGYCTERFRKFEEVLAHIVQVHNNVHQQSLPKPQQRFALPPIPPKIRRVFSSPEEHKKYPALPPSYITSKQSRASVASSSSQSRASTSGSNQSHEAVKLRPIVPSGAKYPYQPQQEQVLANFFRDVSREPTNLQLVDLAKQTKLKTCLIEGWFKRTRVNVMNAELLKSCDVSTTAEQQASSLLLGAQPVTCSSETLPNGQTEAVLIGQKNELPPTGTSPICGNNEPPPTGNIGAPVIGGSGTNNETPPTTEQPEPCLPTELLEEALRVQPMVDMFSGADDQFDFALEQMDGQNAAYASTNNTSAPLSAHEEQQIFDFLQT